MCHAEVRQDPENQAVKCVCGFPAEASCPQYVGARQSTFFHKGYMIKDKN